MWSKEDMKIYRKMIANKKSFEEIKDYFGWDKLKTFPNGKYNDSKFGGLPRFNEFVNELYVNPEKIDYDANIRPSKIFNGEIDYLITFKLDDDDYIMNYFYLKDTVGDFSGKDLYNISFSTKKQYDEYLRTGNDKEYETLTEKNNMIKLLKALSYIVLDFHKYLMRYYKEIIYVLGVTEDKRKIRIYRNVIENSFKNVIEKEGKSSFNLGQIVYYYRIIEV